MGIWEKVPYTNYHDLNLDWIITTMKEIKSDIDLLNEWKASRDQRDAEIDAQLEDLNTRFTALETLYNTFVDEVNTRFTELETEITDQVDALEVRITARADALEADVYARLTALQTALETEMRDFKADVQSLLSVYNTRIMAVEEGLENIIDQLPEMFTIVDPYTGQENSIVNVIYEIVNKTKVSALTASAYDAAALTATAYDALNLTAYTYDFNGADHIGA